MTQIVFIGGGNMARSLIGGLINQGTSAGDIHASEPQAEARQALADDFGIHVHADNTAAMKLADVVVLAVKPQVMAAVCGELRQATGRKDLLFVSIAAGISLANFAHWLGDTAAVVRAMPNTPALIGAGVSGLHANERVTAAQRSLAVKVLAAAGETVWIEQEALMDAVTAVSGSGPAYFFLLMESMIHAAKAQGLDAQTARSLVLQTALGAARMAVAADVGPDVLRQRVTSPNGTTQAALEVFTTAQLPDTVAKAIARATERGRELAAAAGD